MKTRRSTPGIVEGVFGRAKPAKATIPLLPEGAPLPLEWLEIPLETQRSLVPRVRSALHCK